MYNEVGRTSVSILSTGMTAKKQSIDNKVQDNNKVKDSTKPDSKKVRDSKVQSNKVKYVCAIVTLIAGILIGSLVDTSKVFVGTRKLFEARGNRHKDVTVYPNGLSENGVEMAILEHHFHDGELGFAQYVSQYVDVQKFGAKERVVADRVYTGNGVLIRAFDDIHHGDRLYAVAPGLLFVWPFVKLGHIVQVKALNSPTGKPIILESFTDSPRTFHVHNFFSDEEADRLIDRVLEIDDDMNKLQQSHVGHSRGAKLVSKKRTSENAFDQVSDTAIGIRKRSFTLLGIGPYQADMCDGLQLLRYQQKQAYTPHTDYFGLDTTKDWNWDPANNGSNRFATVFLYLSNVTTGGQTVFPKAEMPSDLPKYYQHKPNPLSTDQINDMFGKNSWESEMVQQCSTKYVLLYEFIYHSPCNQLDSLHIPKKDMPYYSTAKKAMVKWTT